MGIALKKINQQQRYTKLKEGVVTHEGGESISLILTLELERLIETAYLFTSHENAVRLLDALKRAKARTNQPQTLENLRQEFGFDEAEISLSIYISTAKIVPPLLKD